jgi:general secretion pathway protein G
MIKNFKKKKNNKGFTLVELLVVIAIIGVLAVVAVPALFKNIEKSKVASLETDINAIKSASLAKYADTGSYPTATDPAATPPVTVESALTGEIENLSKPFEGAVYKLSGSVPTNLVLTVESTTFSDKAQAKLAKDLGVTDADAAAAGANGYVNATTLKYTLIKGN